MCPEEKPSEEKEPEEKELEEKEPEEKDPEEKEPERGRPEPDFMAERLSKIEAKIDKRLGQVEKFLKQTTEMVEATPLLGRIARGMRDPDTWMPDFLKPEKPESPQ